MRTGFGKFFKRAAHVGLVLAISSAIGLTLGLALASFAFASPGVPGMEDPYFPMQWALHNTGQSVPIEVDSTHTIQQAGKEGVDIGWQDTESLLPSGKPPVIVAVIDSGIDLNHPDLQGKILPNGKDFLTGAPMSDEVGHGTHVSGLIAAVSGDGIGITGVAPSSVKILPLKIFSNKTTSFLYNGKLISDIAAQAIQYALDQGASVINMSLGWPAAIDSPNARAAVREALSHGVVIVAAAGNDHRETPSFPCSYAGVLCVGALSNTGELVSFSNYGGSVDLLAPGDGIISTYPTELESRILRINGYEQTSGTSEAAPLVAGIAATLKAIHPSITAGEIKARILSSAGMPEDPNSSLSGSVNLTRALETPPSAVYLPRFKSIDSLVLDDSSGTFSGDLPIDCFGSSCPSHSEPAAQMELSAPGGYAVITAQSLSPSLETGSGDPSASSSWTLHFEGKLSGQDASDLLHLTLSMGSRSWSGDLRLAREASKLVNKGTFSFPKRLDLLSTRNGTSYPKILRIDDVYDPSEPPEYYQQGASTSTGTPVILILPGQNPSSEILYLSKTENVGEIVKIDADLDGKPDYVVIGIDQHDSVSRLVFHFYTGTGELTPLYGSLGQSAWTLNLLDPIGRLGRQSYGQLGSWIRSDALFHGKYVLLPAFTAKGTLPAVDNFSVFDMNHYAGAREHYYYLLPGSSASDSTIPLTPRALDSAGFYNSTVQKLSLSGVLQVSVISPLNPTDSERASGTVRLLIGVGRNLDQTYYQLKASSVSQTELDPVLTQAGAHLQGSSAPVLTPQASGSPSASQGLSVFMQYYDLTRGQASFVNTENGGIDALQVKSLSPFSGLVGMQGYASDGQSEYALVNTRFDLIALRKNLQTGAIQQDSVPINRDSSFPSSLLSESMTPLLFSSAAGQTPSLGAFIDSTLLIGNTIGAAQWDQASGRFVRLARYSVQVPGNCSQMDPFVSSSGLLDYVLLCDAGEHWEFRYLEP